MFNDFDNFSDHLPAADHLDRLRLRRHELIKSQLKLSGSSLAELGRELELKSETMTTVSKGRGKSRRVQLHIAKALGLEPSTLWPEAFSKTSTGEP
ncbi:helix-turn-helix domain-containing protein [Loktanella sp. F6476L]|uniref:helix-turn-helix domain-containing protein n=1 Tax=Loktanella sp. F6476L TaxID=2926405 RepID=UPI001FF6E488|nr:helix-turn-helix domain-containing protein [Loktanella sp. F6476L]MCK0121069.1 helix-turn-helix domain-containing protein [Loktanella sp. F6476L]